MEDKDSDESIDDEALDKSIGRMYVYSSIYDKAPEIAEKIFSGLENEPLKIKKKFHEIYPKMGDIYSQIALDYAFRYLFITSLIKNELTVTASGLIRKLVNKDAAVGVFNDLLKEEFNSSFLEQCMKNSEFMIPKKLDISLFKEYAPLEINKARNYLDSDAIIVLTILPNKNSAHKDNESYLCSELYEKVEILGLTAISLTNPIAEFKNIQLKANKDFFKSRFIFNGPKDRLEREIHYELEKENISNYSLIYSNNIGMNEYLLSRFLVNKKGKPLVKEGKIELKKAKG
jgi:hypothetical protein